MSNSYMSETPATNRKLSELKRKIRDLKIPFPEYLAIWTHDDAIKISEMGEETVTLHSNIDKERNIRNLLISWIERREITDNVKFITTEFVGEKWQRGIISDLWLTEDIVPYFVEIKDVDSIKVQKNYVKEVRKRFNTENLVYIPLTKANEVEIAELVALEDYKRISHPDEFSLLLKLTKKFAGKKLVFINATPQGGGVALMRHALIRLFKLLGVNAHWYVLFPLKEAFDITKTKFHNVLQAVADKDTILTDEDKKLFNDWTADNAEQLKDAYKDADVIVIDDPQPCGLVPYIKKVNPKAKIIYRSHIQIEAHLANKKGTPQRRTWEFIWENIKDSDLFVSHPMSQFIPKDVPKKITVMMPATTDALDGLNKTMKPRHIDYYMKLFDRVVIEADQTPLDRKRPYIIQVARFDPSKGIPDVIESYGLLIDKLKKTKKSLPQLVICGHGSVDDPDGLPIYNFTLELLRSKKYKHLAQDVKVVRLPSSDQMLNALMREAKVALQLSHKEGFEVKVSEALMKHIPIVAYKAGGIPLQVKDGISGYLVPVGDTRAVAARLYDLFTDDDLYHQLRQGAYENVNPQTTTVSNAINWLFLATELLKSGKIVGNGKSVKDLLYKKIVIR